ncbi:ABC transporter ATP-binding protein [Microbacterium esteraromaticum]|uniref:ABC transporter ATP-binding protein n=1 Tax=Microbacterium esteraromaticum TaxID=57043 RepID=UPI0019D33184|nr:ABC transporter ATP-binding protein [Microbacterium esteraromaticum]MBN7793792.1 ABC transporter ATP-binding protein [Microbacterium esteraromaticum]
MASVTLDSVSVRYPSGASGLVGIDLTIADGEFVALVGPSGSGKTTLLRTIAGFLTPTSGAVRIGDRTVAGDAQFVPPEQRELGMVFQQHAVWPHWNVGRNVEYPLRRAGVSRDQRKTRVAEALDLVGLAGYEKRDPATLSGGQRQRVALARALVARPRVLLLDEALSALDEPLRDRLRLELQTLTRELGLTVVHVTHDRAEALALADRVVVLDGGRIQQVGAPDELITRPASGFVARFLSDATLVDGVLSDAGFQADGHPLSVSRDASMPAAGRATAAILPAAVTVTPSDAGDAVVRSSLYTPDGGDAVIDWAGVTLRARTRGIRLAVGQTVRVDVDRVVVYPAESLDAAASAAPTLVSA